MKDIDDNFIVELAGIVILKREFKSARCLCVHLALMAHIGNTLDDIAVNIIITSPLKQFREPINRGVPESTIKLTDFL